MGFLSSGIFKWVFKSGICRKLWPNISLKAISRKFTIFRGGVNLKNVFNKKLFDFTQTFRH